MNSFSRTLFLLLSAASITSSCITSKSLNIEPIQTVTTKLSPNRFVFYYPKTVLSFRVSCIHETFVPGPYAKYSQKYLGVNPIGGEARELWQILNVSLSKNNEPDYTRLFSVEGSPSDLAKVYSAIHSGGITPSIDMQHSGLVEKPEVFPALNFLDMGVTPFILNEKSVFYTRVQVDSGFVKVPVQKNIVVEANLEDKAKEAAEFIFSLRKRRFDIVSGEVDHAIEGKALEVSLAELKRLEDSYLSLFVGKVLSDTASFQYSFEPTAATSQNAILFRFSETNGLLSDDNLAGRPIMLELVAEKNQESLKLLSPNAANKEVVHFPYLFPEVCSLVLTDGKNTLFKQRTTINQLGTVVFFPVSILK